MTDDREAGTSFDPRFIEDFGYSPAIVQPDIFQEYLYNTAQSAI
jgi:hypothetical protein